MEMLLLKFLINMDLPQILFSIKVPSITDISDGEFYAVEHPIMSFREASVELGNLKLWLRDVPPAPWPKAIDWEAPPLKIKNVQND